MLTPERYVEPLAAYVTRKYIDPSLAILPLVAAGAVDVALLRGSAPPPLWALAYTNVLGVVLCVSMLVVFRNRFERRRFRIDGGSVDLPSVVRINGSRLDVVALDSLIWVRGTRCEIGILGWHKEALTGVEIKTKYGGEEVVLVWPVAAFGRKNLEALERTISHRW